MVSNKSTIPIGRRLLHRLLALIGAAALSLLCFLVLPLLQAVSAEAKADMTLVQVDAGNLPPPPPPPPEEEPEPEPEEQEEPPELEPESQQLDLAQLELALGPGLGDGWMGGDFTIKLDNLVSSGDDNDALFALADLDQQPRATYQPNPVQNAKVRKRAPGTVWIIFIVDEQGRVENPLVQSSDHPVFEEPALSAVKKWRFEPGRRGGKPVRSRMRVPITFPGS